MKLIKLITPFILVSLTSCANYLQDDQGTSVTEARSTDQVWQEHKITSEIAALNNKPTYSGKVRINSTATNGKVLLMGQVQDEKLHQELVQQIESISGVEKVYDQIKIKSPLNIKEISYDSWLTTKVKTALLTEQKLDDISIQVITEDKDVFLTGFVSTKTADLATYTARNVVGVKRVIKAFTYID